MNDPTTTTAAQLPLSVVLTCCTCDTAYEPSVEAIARGRFGCPDPSCRGWTFTSELTVPGGAL